MTSGEPNQNASTYISIAVFAWNEERAITCAIASLLEQSLFGELRKRHLHTEIICVANGCTDQTPEVAAEAIGKLQSDHPHRNAWSARVADIRERGKINAWNRFVHQLSDRQARYLFMMDADIFIHRPQTMLNMLTVLEQDPQAVIAVDIPRKDIAFKKRRSLSDRLSLSASEMTQAANAQLCAQLYCIRADEARKIYLPKDLAACEDGFIKTLVCTDFLKNQIQSGRIRVAPDAEHTFEAYTSLGSILKNQKRQVIGQTIVHILIDRYLKLLPAAERQDLAVFLKSKDMEDPSWVKKLIREHLRDVKFCWRLYPGLVGNRLRRLKELGLFQLFRCLPAAIAGECAILAGSFLAYRSLKRGCTDYWPKANRAGFKHRDLPMASDTGDLIRRSIRIGG